MNGMNDKSVQRSATYVPISEFLQTLATDTDQRYYLGYSSEIYFRNRERFRAMNK